MNILILNWKVGENDPFTVFNNCIASNFNRMGRATITIELDDKFLDNLMAATKKGIDFAITFQGLGSAISFPNSPMTVWDQLKIPLFCLHGDHPCHALFNHRGNSDYVIHNYLVSSFAKFANQYIPRTRPAVFITLPLIGGDRHAGEFSGDFFVLPKNLDDLQKMRTAWSEQLGPVTGQFFIDFSHELEHRLCSQTHVDHHALINEMLTEKILNGIRSEWPNQKPADLFNAIHGQLDKCYRNAVSEFIVRDLVDVPMKIYGRGWDNFAKLKNKKHEFLRFDKLVNGDFQFFSNYGIIDVAPSFDSLHDRTCRAIIHKAGFLSSSGWPYGDYFNEDYQTLFFNCTPGNLRDKAQWIMDHPIEHRQRCIEFGKEFKSTFQFYDLLKHFENLRALYYAKKQIEKPVTAPIIVPRKTSLRKRLNRWFGLNG